MRAVVDTNVWVSGVFAPAAHSAVIAHYLEISAFQPVFCDETLLELKDAVTAPVRVARFGLLLVELNNLIRLLTSRGLELPNPKAIAKVCRDPDDDIFIALAIAADADYLVTRDDDLKGDPDVRDYLSDHGVRLVTVREFVAILEASGAA